MPVQRAPPHARVDLQSRRRREVELVPDHVQQQLAEPEHGQRHPHDREDHRPSSAQRARSDARGDPERDPDQQPEHGRPHPEDRRDGEPAPDLLAHRQVVRERVVDVLGQERVRQRDQPLREPAVLDDQGLVEAEGFPCVRDLLRIGPPTDRPPRRIARRQLHEDQEGEDRDDDEDENGVEQPASDVPEHVTDASPGPRPPDSTFLPRGAASLPFLLIPCLSFDLGRVLTLAGSR